MNAKEYVEADCDKTTRFFTEDNDTIGNNKGFSDNDAEFTLK